MNLPWILMHVRWPTTMQDFRRLQGDKSKFWVEFLRGYSKNYPFETHSNWLFPVLIGWINIGSQSWCKDFPLSHEVNIMICQIFLPFTAVYSQSNQRNDIFTSGENVLSNHKEPVRSTGFSMRETPYLFTKFIMRKDQTQCWPPGPFPILVSTI